MFWILMMPLGAKQIMGSFRGYIADNVLAPGIVSGGVPTSFTRFSACVYISAFVTRFERVFVDKSGALEAGTGTIWGLFRASYASKF